MLYVDYDECSVPIYTVVNDYGECLIRTSSGSIAYFVDKHSKGLPRGMYLTIGGDPGSRFKEKPIFRKAKRYSR